MDLTDTEIVKLTGPLLIITILNWGLFGVLTVQVFLYSQAFPKDRSLLKAVVYGIYLLETAQTLGLTGTVWPTFVKGYGHNINLSTIGSTWVSTCLLGGAAATVAQTYYAYRIMIVSKNRIITFFIMLMSLMSFISAVVVGVSIQQAENFESIQPHALRTSSFIGIWLGTSCACDILIAACMFFYLSRRIRDGLFPKTQALVSRVIRMTIETGALTASVSIASLAVFYAPDIGGFLYYGVPISALTKLYSNTMLALLNSRMKLGIISESTTWYENELPLIPLSHPRQSGGTNVKFASADTSKTEMTVEKKEEIITIDELKITSCLSVPSSKLCIPSSFSPPVSSQPVLINS